MTQITEANTEEIKKTFDNEDEDLAQLALFIRNTEKYIPSNLREKSAIANLVRLALFTEDKGTYFLDESSEYYDRLLNAKTPLEVIPLIQQARNDTSDIEDLILLAG